MSKNRYKILKIKYNTLDKYGDVFIVYANKAQSVIEEFGIVSYVDHEYEDTEVFIYPQNEDIIRPIGIIGSSGRLWEPDMGEFKNGVLCIQGEKKIAHYHESFLNKRVEMTYLPYEVSFNQIDWHKLYEINECDEPWKFSIGYIQTPYGEFDVKSFVEVNQNGQAGIELDVYGYLKLRDLPGYNGGEKDVCIQTIAIVRQPYNVWLWIHFFDDANKHIASFFGIEKDVLADEFVQYVNMLKLKKNGQ